MSKMQDFYVKALSTEEGKKKIESILGGKQIQELNDTELKNLGSFAKELGFEISLDEAKIYLNSDAKLSENELDTVAGGTKVDVYADFRDGETGVNLSEKKLN